MTHQTMSIGELAASGALVVSDGYRTRRSELGSDGFRILRAADVLNGSIRFGSPDFVRKEHASAVGLKVAQSGDVILTTKGTVGRVAVVPELTDQAVYSPQLCFFRVRNPHVIDPRFLRYWFDSAEFWTQACHRMNNSDMAPYINLADVRSLRLSLPSIRSQRAIAAVLGALDDKIATNRRVAATAGELASLIFRSALSRSATRRLPFGDVASIGGGGTPRTSETGYWGGGIPWATPTDVTALSGPYIEQTERTITEAGLAACASALYPAGSILMTSRATIGAFAIAQRPMAVNQGFIVVDPVDEATRWWIFHDMCSRVDEFVSHANGATFLELSRGRFRQIEARLGAEAEMREFGARASSLHELACQVLRESEILAQLRDTLLPHLMSGRLRIRDAEKQVGEVV